MKNINIYRFLEKHLAEDLFSEVYSILSNTSISTKNKLRLLAENYSPRLDYIKADILIKKYEKGKTMSNEENNKTVNNPKDEKETLVQKAEAVLRSLNELVNEYNNDFRRSYEKERQIRNIINSANAILYNTTKNVYSIPTDLHTVRELVFNIQHVDGILESFNGRIERLTKRGSYDEIPEQLKMVTEFTTSLNAQIESLNKLITKKMEEGFGSRRDLTRFAMEKENAAKEKLKELKKEVADAYEAGEFFSKLESKLKDKISDEAIIQFKKEHVNAFLDANKEKIFKALTSKKDLYSVSEQFETDMRTLYAFLNEKEKDKNIESLFEEIKNKLFEEVLNNLEEKKATVKELNKKYPKSLVRNAISAIKEKNQKEPSQEEANQKEANQKEPSQG